MGWLKRRRQERYRNSIATLDSYHWMSLPKVPPEQRGIVHTLYLLNTGRISKDEARRRIDTELPPP